MPAGRLKGLRSHLAAAARKRNVVTYGELMRKYHLSRGKVLSQVIGEIDMLECEEGGPGFAAIIVRKDTGFPGGGYFCDDVLPTRLRRSKDRASDPKLSEQEQKHVKRQQHKIWDFYSYS